MRVKTRNTKNFISNLPSKTQFNYKILDNTDELLNEIKSVEINIEDKNLLEFYKKFISFIETHFVNVDGKFEMQRYAELRNNLTDIDEEFIKEYGHDIIQYIKNDKELLTKDIENIDKMYDFTTRSQKVKKTIKENDKVKEIYVREKRDPKEYDFFLYINEIAGSIQHLICKEIDNQLNSINTNEEFFKHYQENKDEITDDILNDIELVYGFLKNSNVIIFKDLYNYYTKNIDKYIKRVLRTTTQFSRFKKYDVFEEYAQERNSKQAIKKVKKEIRYRNK